MGRGHRKSLSDWWSRPDGSTHSAQGDEDECDDRPGSPAKRCCSPLRTFDIGDDSDTQSVAQSLEYGSPKKRAALMSPFRTPACDSVISGSPNDLGICARAICADYFENNVSPVLKYIQQTQEQLVTQLKDLAATLDEKADAEDVVPRSEMEQIAARVATSRADDSKVALQIRMEELASSMHQKASIAQLSLKANVKDATTSAQLADLVAAAVQKADMAISIRCEQDLEARLRSSELQVVALTEDLSELKRRVLADAPRQAGDNSEITKVKAVFAAAGMRVERQMKEMRQQMQQLNDQRLGEDVGARWPGRKLDVMSAASGTDKISDNGSDNGSDKLSLGASAAASLTGSTLDPDEKAELKKIQTIVAAAGTSFLRDLREVKGQMRDMRAELIGLKETKHQAGGLKSWISR